RVFFEPNEFVNPVARRERGFGSFIMSRRSNSKFRCHTRIKESPSFTRQYVNARMFVLVHSAGSRFPTEALGNDDPGALQKLTAQAPRVLIHIHLRLTVAVPLFTAANLPGAAFGMRSYVITPFSSCSTSVNCVYTNPE